MEDVMKVYKLSCTRCNQQKIKSLKMEQLLNNAVKRNWKLVNGKWVCPMCVL